MFHTLNRLQVWLYHCPLEAGFCYLLFLFYLFTKLTHDQLYIEQQCVQHDTQTPFFHLLLCLRQEEFVPFFYVYVFSPLLSFDIGSQ